MNLTLPGDFFPELADDTAARSKAWLGGVLTINGVDHRLEAIAISNVGGLQKTEDPSLNESLDEYLEAISAERPFDTVLIRDRQYLLVLIPSSASMWRDGSEEP